MNKLIEKFPSQLHDALLIGEKTTIRKHETDIHNITIIGLGGSGLSGDIISAYGKNHCNTPILVSKGYNAPNYINKNSLVILVSYSGNTEETISAYRNIASSKAKIVMVTSGGKLMEIAKENDYDFYTIPSDWKIGRACLGYMVVGQFVILNKLGMIHDAVYKKIYTASDVIKFNIDEIQAIAKKVAHKINRKRLVVYTTEGFEPVVTRYKQQMNENARRHISTGVIPEMNHNELSAWNAETKDNIVLFLRTKDESERNKLRININKKVISEYSEAIIDIFAKGKNQMEQSLYLIHIGDWISYYLSLINSIETKENIIVDYLKSELSK